MARAGALRFIALLLVGSCGDADDPGRDAAVRDGPLEIQDAATDAVIDAATEAASLDAETPADLAADGSPDGNRDVSEPDVNEAEVVPEGSTDGGGGDAQSCRLPVSLDDLARARFAFDGNQRVSRFSRSIGPQCSLGVVEPEIHTHVRLTRHENNWYFLYEGPYQRVPIPAMGTPLVTSTAISPHEPYFTPTVETRGIPLSIDVMDEVSVRFSASAAASSFDGIRTPICPYNTPGGLLGATLVASIFSITVSLITGEMSLIHSCQVASPTSGCPQPSLSETIRGAGRLVCSSDRDAGSVQ